MASPLENVFITGYSKGLVNNKKPFLLPDQAWQTMENAYAFRERILKREGLDELGRLRRNVSSATSGYFPIPNTVVGATTIDIADILINFRTAAPPAIPEPNAEVQQKSLVITIAAPDAANFTDNGDGTFTVTGIGVAAGSYINYETGQIHLVTTPQAGGATVTATYAYFPTLPVMGISNQDQATINGELTIIWDQKYAYIYNAGNFQEYLPATNTTWASSDHDFFWAYNYRQTTSANRIMFETNFLPNAQNPMRFTNGASWTPFVPRVNGPVGPPYQAVVSCRIIVSYFSRLILLNTWEAPSDFSTPPVNFFARCRFSAEGDPTAVNAFADDIYGQGGFLDAPTSEMIVGAEFVKNTLIVSFERSKWQLRYVGEYGLPFIWERVSIDFGSESTFSSVAFDSTVLDVGDKAIVSTNAVESKRIDLEIPDQVILIQNQNFGPLRVWGVRDYFKELVFWNYPDVTTALTPGSPLVFPNKVLVYNYRNNSWGIFRDSVTAFGYFQYDQASTPNITWDDQNILWDDENVTWANPDQGNPGFQFVISGNQQGYVHIYASKTPDDPSLTIRAVNITPVTIYPITLTIPNHNLLFGEIIYLTGIHFLNTANFQPVLTSLNNSFFRVTVIDSNTISLTQWDFTNQTYLVNFPVTFTQGGVSVPIANLLYVGCGEVTLFPKLNIESKDINIYQNKGLATKLSHIDFLLQPSAFSAMTVNISLNSSQNAVSGNLLVGDTGVSTVQTTGFYTPSSDYSWFRFYATASCQYFAINLTYDDNLMNTLTTHQSQWTLYAINAAVKRGGKILF